MFLFFFCCCILLDNQNVRPVCSKENQEKAIKLCTKVSQKAWIRTQSNREYFVHFNQPLIFVKASCYVFFLRCNICTVQYYLKLSFLLRWIHACSTTFKGRGIGNQPRKQHHVRPNFWPFKSGPFLGTGHGEIIEKLCTYKMIMHRFVFILAD